MLIDLQGILKLNIAFFNEFSAFAEDLVIYVEIHAYLHTYIHSCIYLFRTFVCFYLNRLLGLIYAADITPNLIASIFYF